MASQFINIPEMEGLLNSYLATTNEPIIYKIPVTYLQNLSSTNPMIIDSSSNIVLQARNNNYVRVNNKMGIGLVPSSAYSLHVLGDVCINGNMISNNFSDLSSKYYSLQSSFTELSNNNYAVKNLLNNFILGTGYYGTITLINNSIYDISFRVSWVPGYLSEEQEYSPNYVSVNSINGSTNVNISNTNRLASRNSNFFINIKSNYNSFVNERLVDYSYVNFNNSPVTTISSEFFDNDNKHRITINVSNFDDIEDNISPITINYNPLYKGFFGTFVLGNKTNGARIDYSYSYLSISGSNVTSITITGETISSVTTSINSISSEKRLAYADSSLNLSLVIYNGFDISVNTLPTSIIGISNNILTSPNRTFGASTINYNYNIIPLIYNLVDGIIGLSFEMYKTGFFGTFIVGNKTADISFDYSYNYISISGSNVNSNTQTLSTVTTSINSISSENRLAYADSSLNLSLVIYNGYDISANALPTSIIGLNILRTARTFSTSTINYNYKIIPIASTNYLVNGTIGVSFEMYKTGFFGTFRVGNKTASTSFDYSYNYLSINELTVNSNTRTLSTVTTIDNSISSENRLAYADSSLNLSLVIYNGYDISANALPTSIIGISNNILNSGTRTFTTSTINYNYKIIPLSYNLLNGLIGLSFEMYKTGFFGIFRVGNKTASTSFDYSYSYLSINGSNVNSNTQTLSTVTTSINSISSENRLAYADSSLNLSLVIYNGYDISVNTLPTSIIGLNILRTARTFTTSTINYNYNIIPLSSYLVNGLIGLSFEMYRTGFFGTFRVGNKTAGTSFDYSYNYISINGSNVNSNTQTLSTVTTSINSISSENRLAYADSSLNLSLVIYNGYDISANALPTSIIGLNILTSPRTFGTSTINYNYKIIPVASTNYLVNGTIGLSFELYKTGFFGTIIVNNNNIGYSIGYNYTYLTFDNDRISVPVDGFISINNNLSNSITISKELRVITNTSEITIRIRTEELAPDISYIISNGILIGNTDYISDSFKYYNFDILPNNNNSTITVDIIIDIDSSIIAPLAPTNLQHSIDNNSAFITWNAASTNTGGTPIQSYKLYRFNNSSYVLFRSNITTTYTRVNNPTTNNTIYTFTVTAVNSAGLESTRSQSVTVNIPIGTNPQPPTDVELVNIVGRAANITWVAPTNTGGYDITIQSYSVYNNGELDTANILTTSFSKFNSDTVPLVTSLTVRAINNLGLTSVSSSPPIVVTIPGSTTQRSPGPPTNVLATIAENGNSATITWTAPINAGADGQNDATIQSYRLYNNYILFTSYITETFTTVSNSSAHDISYSFTVSAFNSGGLQSIVSDPPLSFTLIPLASSGFNGSIRVITSGYSNSSYDVNIIIYADDTLRFNGQIDNDTSISIAAELGPRLSSSSSIIYIYAQEVGSNINIVSYALRQAGGSTANITSQPVQTFTMDNNSYNFQGYTIDNALNNATLVVYVVTSYDN